MSAKASFEHGATTRLATAKAMYVPTDAAASPQPGADDGIDDGGQGEPFQHRPHGRPSHRSCGARYVPAHPPPPHSDGWRSHRPNRGIAATRSSACHPPAPTPPGSSRTSSPASSQRSMPYIGNTRNTLTISKHTLTNTLVRHIFPRNLPAAPDQLKPRARKLGLEPAQTSRIWPRAAEPAPRSAAAPPVAGRELGSTASSTRASPRAGTSPSRSPARATRSRPFDRRSELSPGAPRPPRRADVTARQGPLKGADQG